MIYHHLNIPSLTYFLKIDILEQTFFVDSLSLRLVCLILGLDKPRVPGSIHLKGLLEDPQSSVFLTAYSSGFENEIILPFFKTFEDIENYNWHSFAKPMGDNPLITKCFLGVSSPKQNLIAQKLQKILPNIDYFCIGAIADNRVIENGFILKFLSKYNVEFAFHFFLNPRRTVLKLAIMSSFFIKFIFSKKFRKTIFNYLIHFADISFFEYQNVNK
jgi:hypothetical protein